MNTARIAIPTLALLTSAACAQRAVDAAHQPQPAQIAAPSVWTHYAGNPKRAAHAAHHQVPSLAQPVWTNTGHTTVPQSGLVADDHRVYALTRDADTAHAVALDRSTGSTIWSAPIAPPVLDSWSTPAIDTEHATLIVASADTIAALDAGTGEPRWTTTVDAVIVNASPVVTDDLGDRDRVLITTFSFGTGTGARLVCINSDPFNPDTNPHQPGDIVWSLPLGADSSGNTPAYQNGRVYLATASGASSQRGTVRCYDITADSAPASPSWSFTNTINAGFFGGVAIARGHIYASSFSFTGLQTSANTVKLDRNTGQLIWSVPTNRTDATPIVLPNGDLIISSGVATGAFGFLPFFGSLPSIQYIHDHGQTASLAWDSALATHDDLNRNSVWDFGEPFLSIGGWTHQPIALTIDAVPHLLVGTLPESRPGVNVDHNTDLRLIDLTKAPDEPGFIADHAPGTGNTPAYASGWIYTAGSGGIHAFAPPSSPTARVRGLLDRYTRGELTAAQLMERLPR